MKCKKCGTELPNDARECTNCHEAQNEDVFSEESKWVFERADARGGRIKKIGVVLMLFFCVSLLALSYAKNLFPRTRSSTDSLPPYAVVEGEDGEIKLIDTQSKQTLVISKDAFLSNIMLNDKEDALFFIVKDKITEKTTLCRRFISNLVYDNLVIAEDVADYLINREADTVLYRKENGELWYGETADAKTHRSLHADVTEYYLSHSGDNALYIAKDGEKSVLYSFDGTNEELICPNARILAVKDDLRKVYFTYGGALFLCNTRTGESKCLVASFGELIKLYHKENLIYYTATDKSGTKTSLYGYDMKAEMSVCLTDSLAEVLYIAATPNIIYSETTLENEIVYRFAKATFADKQATIEGKTLSDFMINESGSMLFFLDSSAKQTRVVSYHINGTELKNPSVADVDVYALCALIKDKPLTVKNVNPHTRTADLWYGGGPIATGVSIYPYSRIETQKHLLQTHTFDVTDTATGESTPYYAVLPLRDSDAVLFFDSKGPIMRFDGGSVSELAKQESENIYVISEDCVLYETENGFTVHNKNSSTEIAGEIKAFLYVEPYGNKPYQLNDD